MNREEAKDLADILRQIGLSRKETMNAMDTAMRSFTEELRSTRKLWKDGNRSSFLIKLGLAFIAFPDPTITDVIGSALVAAGVVQLKMRNSALHIDDVYKTFPKVFKELSALKQCLV